MHAESSVTDADIYDMDGLDFEPPRITTLASSPDNPVATLKCVCGALCTDDAGRMSWIAKHAACRASIAAP